jgi:hypothetical protein
LGKEKGLERDAFRAFAVFYALTLCPTDYADTSTSPAYVSKLSMAWARFC